MRYYIYENWRAEGHKARIHRANCPYCKEGAGIHPNAGDENGRWLGPFSTFREAADAAEATEGRVSQCKHCSPGSGYPARVVQSLEDSRDAQREKLERRRTRVLIDRKGLQTRWHLNDRMRLCEFITRLLTASCIVAIASESAFSENELGEFDVFVIPTRDPKRHDYSQRELDRIDEFVRRGGGLLLMSNHGSRWASADAILAERFGIRIQSTDFRNKSSGTPTVLSGGSLNPKHPIVLGPSQKGKVHSIVTNTCCSIVSEIGEPVVWISGEMRDRENEGVIPTGDQLFAHALDLEAEVSTKGKGRIVTLADSGFIGSTHTRNPGIGLASLGGNLLFIENAIRWLGHQLR